MMKKLKPWALFLAAVGAANWGLVSWFDFNLLDILSFGNATFGGVLGSVIAVSGFLTLYFAFMD